MLLKIEHIHLICPAGWAYNKLTENPAEGWNIENVGVLEMTLNCIQW